MKNALLLGTAAALLTAITPAGAQETTAPAPTTAPDAAAPSAGVQSYSDADLKAFVRAAVAADKIQKDAAVPAAEKQPKMLAAVQAEGLDPVKFNAIAQASQTDAALKERIQAAASATAPAPTTP